VGKEGGGKGKNHCTGESLKMNDRVGGGWKNQMFGFRERKRKCKREEEYQQVRRDTFGVRKRGTLSLCGHETE